MRCVVCLSFRNNLYFARERFQFASSWLFLVHDTFYVFDLIVTKYKCSMIV